MTGYKKANDKNGFWRYLFQKSKRGNVEEEENISIESELLSNYVKVETKKRNYKIEFSQIMQQNLLAFAF